jgi:colanic acid/amylovoran biosynthesis glycosyltransferase
MLVFDFPTVSETFVVDQITGLLRRGSDVDIFALRVRQDVALRPEDAQLGLTARASALEPSPIRSRLRRASRSLRDIAAALPKAPVKVARTLLLPRTSDRRLRPFYHLAPFLGRRPYDVVHCHFGPMGVVGSEIRELGGFDAPLVTQFHGFDATSYVEESARNPYLELFARGELFLCVSRRIQQRMVELGCDERKTRVHHTGVDVARIEFAPPAATQGPIRVLTVGRLVDKKGIEYGLRAMALLRRRHPDLRYVIVGDGPLKASLVTLAEQLGIGESVTFAGAQPRSEVASLMKGSTLLLAPSVTASNGDEEGIPVVAMEALAAGLPVVGTLHAGVPELITNGISGLLAPERDPAALAELMEFVVTRPEQVRRMAEAGRRTVEEEFDVNKLNVRLLDLYRQLTTSSPLSRSIVHPA